MQRKKESGMDLFLECGECGAAYDELTRAPVRSACCGRLLCLECALGGFDSACGLCDKPACPAAADRATLAPTFERDAGVLNAVLRHRAQGTAAAPLLQHCATCKLELGDDRVATRKCEASACDGRLLCDLHAPAHRDRGHVVVALPGTAAAAGVSSEVGPLAQCPRHQEVPGATLLFYCVPCGVAVCSHCTVVDHRPGCGHAIENLGAAALHLGMALGKDLDACEHEAAVLKALTAQLKTAMCATVTNHAAALLNIDAEVHRVVAAAQARGDALKLETTAAFGVKHKALAKHINSANDALREATGVAELGTLAKASDNPVMVAYARQTLGRTLAVLKQACPRAVQVDSTLRLVKDDAPAEVHFGRLVIAAAQACTRITFARRDSQSAVVMPGHDVVFGITCFGDDDKAVDVLPKDVLCDTFDPTLPVAVSWRDVGVFDAVVRIPHEFQFDEIKLRAHVLTHVVWSPVLRIRPAIAGYGFDGASAVNGTVTVDACNQTTLTAGTSHGCYARTARLHTGTGAPVRFRMDMTGAGWVVVAVGSLDKLASNGNTSAQNPGHAFYYSPGSVGTCEVNGKTGFARCKSGACTVVLEVRDTTLQFSVDGVMQPGSWTIPDEYYVLVSPWTAGARVVMTTEPPL